MLGYGCRHLWNYITGQLKVLFAPLSLIKENKMQRMVNMIYFKLQLIKNKINHNDNESFYVLLYKLCFVS